MCYPLPCAGMDDDEILATLRDIARSVRFLANVVGAVVLITVVGLVLAVINALGS